MSSIETQLMERELLRSSLSFCLSLAQEALNGDREAMDALHRIIEDASRILEVIK